MLRGSIAVGEVVGVLGGAGLLAGSWLLVARHDVVPDWEAKVFDAVNSLPDVLWPVVWGPMQVGSVIGSLAVVATVTVRTGNRRLGAAALGASQAGYWLSKTIKRMARRGRPGDLLEGVSLREHASGLGYVSGHAAVAFALAAALAPSAPPVWRAGVVGTAALVAGSRVYAGAHLPLDVVGGVGFGVLLGSLARWVLGLGGEGLPPSTR